MSAVCILAPVVIAAWPAFGAAVTAAAASLGYQVLAEVRGVTNVRVETKVELEIPRSEIVTSSLGRDQRIRVTRDNVTVAFGRDARNHASVCVTGEGRTEEELRAIGHEIQQRVVQQYVYQRLMGEMEARGYNVVAEEIDTDASIHLKVRHWEN